MDELTILASPKSFLGTAAEIQKKALESWNAIEGKVNIFLYGNIPGIEEIVAKFHFEHVPDIACAPTGVPLFTAIAEHASTNAKAGRQMYVNADIVLPPDLISRLRGVTLPEYLVSGQRYDLDREVYWDFGRPWKGQLEQLLESGWAQLHGPTGMDYFVFPRGMWRDLRPLPIGRGGYDSALLAHCLRRAIPVVDATPTLPVIHHWHDYSQLPGGLREVHGGHEAQELRRVHDIWHSPPLISDADFVLTGTQLAPGDCRGDWLRAREISLRYRHNRKWMSYCVRGVWHLRNRLVPSSQS